jgi:arylsulfatase A-like enzyme
MLSKGWMVFDGEWKLIKHSEGEAMLFNLKEDPLEQINLASDSKYGDVYRRLDAELTQEIMESMVLSMHDRLVCSSSLADSEEFGHQGWQWKFPMDASQATKVGKNYY